MAEGDDWCDRNLLVEVAKEEVLVAFVYPPLLFTISPILKLVSAP